MTAGAEGISAPEHLTPAHDLTAFDSGIPALDDWLKRRALANEEAGGSRTYVVCAGGRVVGYYALATGGVVQEAATGRVRRNMPDPVPVMVLGRLAVHRAYRAGASAEGCCATQSSGLCRPPISAVSGPSWSTRSQRTRSASTRAAASRFRRSLP